MAHFIFGVLVGEVERVAGHARSEPASCCQNVVTSLKGAHRNLPNRLYILHTDTHNTPCRSRKVHVIHNAPSSSNTASSRLRPLSGALAPNSPPLVCLSAASHLSLHRLLNHHLQNPKVSYPTLSIVQDKKNNVSRVVYVPPSRALAFSTPQNAHRLSARPPRNKHRQRCRSAAPAQKIHMTLPAYSVRSV